MPKHYNELELIKQVESVGYKFIMYQKCVIHIEDADGYKYTIIKRDLNKGRKPHRFHPGNPYTIFNINHYIERNNINLKLVSERYSKNSVPLEWICACGEHFNMPFAYFQGGKHQCNSCGRKKTANSRRTTLSKILNKMKEFNLSPIEEIDFQSQNESFIYAKDDQGYKYHFKVSGLMKGKKPERFSSANEYTIYNINHFLSEVLPEYVCLSSKYISNTTPLEIIHLKCGTHFKMSLVEMQGRKGKSGSYIYRKQCPSCRKKLIESCHASVLKQIFIHEYPDTILEDRSCVNPKTAYALPTDIVNHRLKLAIEIQSSMHDKDSQKQKDAFKRNYWISKGYSFYSPDIRDFTILELVQIFFPNMQSIPSYVTYHFSETIDFRVVQQMLNDGFSLSQISKLTNIKYSTVASFIRYKKVILPNDYHQRFSTKKAIIQMLPDGTYVNTFESLMSAARHGYATGAISRVLRGERELSYGYKWKYK